MKRILTALVVCCVAGTLLAAELPWKTSLPDAMAQAAKEKKLLFLDFTGSDWCDSCRMLDLTVFSKPEFADYAKTNLVLVQLDFPFTKVLPPKLQEANDALREKYKVTGFPTLIVMKPDGTILWKRDGLLAGGLPAWITKFEELKSK